jgi:hypothetical protein
METIINEAKRAITECDQQMNRNNSTDEFYTASGNTIGRRISLNTPPAHSIKSPHDARIQMLKVEVKDVRPPQLMMIEDNLTPAVYDESSSNQVYGDDMSDTRLAADRKKQVETRQTDSYYDDSAKQESPKSAVMQLSESETAEKNQQARFQRMIYAANEDNPFEQATKTKDL